MASRTSTTQKQSREEGGEGGGKESSHFKRGSRSLANAVATSTGNRSLTMPDSTALELHYMTRDLTSHTSGNLGVGQN